MIEVRLPDGSIAQFPDGMADADIEAVLQREFGGAPVEAPAPPVAQQGGGLGDILGGLGQSASSFFGGVTQGATMGAYDEIASAVGAPIKGIENLVTGQDKIDGLGDVLPFLGRSFQDVLQGQQALGQQQFEQAPAAYITGDIAGSFGSALGLAGKGVTTFGEVARPTIAGMLARGAGEGGLTGATSGFNTGQNGNTTLPARLNAALQGGAAGALIGGATGGVLGGLAGKAQVDAIPSVQELADQAGALYTAARNSGVTASPTMSQGIATTIEGIARAENIILPSGKVNSTYPKIAGVLSVFDEYKGLPLDVGQMQAIRRNLKDAAGSVDPGERRVATLMLGEFDDFASSVAPELAEASDLYWRSKMGELIEEAIELAGNRSGQYSQSGMENALRTQFRQLNARIIKGQIKGIPPELAEQIALVADGSPFQNLARFAGKFAVRSPLSSLPTLFAGGTVAAGGNPLGGALAAGAVALPAEAGKALAERISIGNANVASALARSGGALPAWQFSPASGAIVQALSNAGSRVLPNF